MIGVLFATIAEAEPFLCALKAEASGVSPIPEFTGALPETGAAPLRIGIIGMGPDAAGKAARGFISMGPLSAVVNAGVCGSLDNGCGFDPGVIAGIREAVGVSSQGRTCPVLPPHEAGPWRHLPSARLVTVDEPVFSRRRRNELSAIGDLVDMEGASVALAAWKAGVPCWMIKGITDLAGDGDRETLHRHLDWVSQRIAHCLLEGLPRLPAAGETTGAACREGFC
ncbi:MAG: hypothetical protein PVH30_00775 [Desulfobacterales bacterium]|jgi:adenosylhomocysteine nucleosidase